MARLWRFQTSHMHKTPPQLISLLLGLQDIHVSAVVIDIKQLDHVMTGMQTVQRQRPDLCNVMQTQPHVLWDLQVGTHTHTHTTQTYMQQSPAQLCISKRGGA